jgi:hypothetical protein
MGPTVGRDLGRWIGIAVAPDLEILHVLRCTPHSVRDTYLTPRTLATRNIHAMPTFGLLILSSGTCIPYDSYAATPRGRAQAQAAQFGPSKARSTASKPQEKSPDAW